MLKDDDTAGKMQVGDICVLSKSISGFKKFNCNVSLILCGGVI